MKMLFKWLIVPAAAGLPLVLASSNHWQDGPGYPHGYGQPHCTELSVVEKTLQKLNLTADAFGATVFSYLYGFPLPSYSASFQGSPGLSAIGTNGVYTTGRQFTATDTTVVRTNVDTIYAISVLDLSQGDLAITVPDMSDDIYLNRYFAFGFYDPFGDNYASLGSVHSTRPGVYLLRASLPSTKSSKSKAECPTNFTGCLTSHTLNGALIIRAELKTGGTEDVAYVNSFFSKIHLTKTGNRTVLGSPLVPADFQNVSTDSVEASLQLTARLAPRNPPQDVHFAKDLNRILSLAGIDTTTAQYSQPPGVNLTAVAVKVNETLDQFYADPANNVPLNNGWSTLSPSFSGSFINGTDVVARAFVARFVYLENTPDQAIYPTPSQQTYTLQSDDQAYLIRFGGGRPPLPADGFWSLTIYDSRGYLIANPQNIYALGDRSNLTYSNGTRVYADATNAESGVADMTRTPFEILVQKTTVAPPANWTSNWLPAPADGAFELTLRFYAPTEQLTSGSYEYPSLTEISAIR